MGSGGRGRERVEEPFLDCHCGGGDGCGGEGEAYVSAGNLDGASITTFGSQLLQSQGKDGDSSDHVGSERQSILDYSSHI